MAGVSPENIPSLTNPEISSYFSYATMMYNEPSSLPDGVFNDTMMPIVVHKVMMHMALKRGLQQYGVWGEEAVSTELMQIHMQNTFKPQHYADLTQVQRRKALESLLFLEEKKIGAIKGRMCADDSKQRMDFAKGEATLPTVTTDAVIITSAIDAHENRDVAVIDFQELSCMQRWMMLCTWSCEGNVR